MRTSLDIPDEMFRRAKVKVAREGTTLRELILSGLDLKLREDGTDREQLISEIHGSLKEHRDAVDEIDRLIEAEFGQIDPEDWK